MKGRSCVWMLTAAAAAGLLSASGAAAQAPMGAGVTAAAPAASHPQLDAYRQSRAGMLMNDFGELGRYRAANLSLAPPATGERRVLFFGDSITDGWKLERYFPGRNYVNRGIGGQTTSQMLVRFRQDVLDLKPRVLLILAGTNDIAGNTGPISVEDIERNFATMAELARAHQIVTIFESVLPVNGDVPGKRELFETRPASQITALNAWMKQYAAANGAMYLDYYAAMVDERAQLRRNLSADGLHPNDTGYQVMAPLAQSAIDRALQH